MAKRGGADKAELFRAVFEDVENDLTLRSIAAPPPGADPWARLTSGLHGFLVAATEPAVQRVTLVDGPVVLGWQTLREIQQRNSIALINEVVREAIAAGIIDDQPVGELTHMLVCRAGRRPHSWSCMPQIPPRRAVGPPKFSAGCCSPSPSGLPSSPEKYCGGDRSDQCMRTSVAIMEIIISIK
jgi:hypothetical protein